MIYGNFDESNLNFPFNLSERDKKANDFYYAKQLMDFYDVSNKIDDNRVSKMQENYLLHSGRWPQLEQMDSSVQFQLQTENILLGGGTLKHYPLIDSVSKSIVADILINPVVPIIKDFSSKANNLRKEHLQGMVKQYFKEKYVVPEINKLYQQYLASNNAEEVMALSPEDQDQVMADIERRALENLPQVIKEAMEQYRTADEEILYAFFNDASRVLNVPSKLATGAENAVITGEVYWRMGILAKNPIMETLNPKYVTWGGSEHTEFCEDGQFAKYEQYLTPQDVVSKYGYYLKTKDVNKLRDLFAPIPGAYSRQKNTNNIDFEIVEAIADNPELQNIDLRNREGQNEYVNLLRNLESNHRQGFGVRECYITHRWTKRFNKVERVVNGKKKEYIVAEHYEKNTSRGDIKVTPIIAPNIWHGVKLGVTEEDYIYIESVPGQYNNFRDPFKVDLTIYGGKLNTFSNNVENASHIDLGKPWQYRYNLLMKKWEERDATDIGKVLVGQIESKPDDWSLSEWYMSLHLGKFLLTKSAYDGRSQAGQTDLIRSEDLSQNVTDIINQLEYVERKCYSSMYYNPNKMGQISQYATNQNTQANISSSDRQMYRFYNKFREIKVNALNALLRYTFIAYEDNDLKKEALLSEYCKAYLDINQGEFNPMDISFSIVDDFKESEKLEQIRQLSLSMIQNGLSGSEIASIINADSMGEVQDILKKFEQRLAKQAASEHENQMALEQERRKTLEASEKARQEFALLQTERENEVRIKLADLNNDMMANAADINKDGINDSLQKALLDLENDYKKHKDNLEFNYFKLGKELNENSKESEKDRNHEISLEKIASKNKSKPK